MYRASEFGEGMEPLAVDGGGTELDCAEGGLPYP